MSFIIYILFLFADANTSDIQIEDQPILVDCRPHTDVKGNLICAYMYIQDVSEALLIVYSLRAIFSVTK